MRPRRSAASPSRCSARPVSGSEAALATAGPAILIDDAAVGLGFGVLSLSQVPANARLGGLLMVSVLSSLAATALLLPALLAARGKP